MSTAVYEEDNISVVDVTKADDHYDDDDWDKDDDVQLVKKDGRLSRITEESKLSPAASIETLVDRAERTRRDDFVEKTERTQRGDESTASISLSRNPFVPVSDAKKLLSKDYREYSERQRFNGHSEMPKGDWQKSPVHNISTANSSVPEPKTSTPKEKNPMSVEQHFNSPVKNSSRPRSFFTSTPNRNADPNACQLENIPFSSIRDEHSVASTSIEDALKNININDTTNKYCEAIRPKHTYEFKRKNYVNSTFTTAREVTGKWNKLKSSERGFTDNILADMSNKWNYPPVETPQKKHQVYASTPSPRESNRISPFCVGDDECPIVIAPTPYTFYGFVNKGEEWTQRVSVINRSGKTISMTVFVKKNKQPEDKFFEVISDKNVMIRANQTEEVNVRFSPRGANQYKGVLKIEIAGTVYNHILFGFGGAATVQLVVGPRIRFIPTTLQYIMCPQNLSNFSFTLENAGERVAFAHVVAVDVNGHKMEGVSFKATNLYIQSDNGKVDVDVSVRDFVMENFESQRNQQNSSVSSGKIINIPRYSSASLQSSNSGHLFDIRVYWGTERGRLRAKKYILETKMDHFGVGEGDLVYPTRDIYTEINDAAVFGRDDAYLSERDVDTFRAQIRYITIRIGNDKAYKERNALSNVRTPASSTVPEGYYCPQEVSPDNTIDNSALSIVATNKTLIAKRKI